MNKFLFKIWLFLLYFPIFFGFLFKNFGLSYEIINIIFLISELFTILLGIILLKLKLKKITLIGFSLIFVALIGSVFKNINLVDYLIPALVLNRFVFFVGFIKMNDTENYKIAKKTFIYFIYSQIFIGLLQIFIPHLIIDITLPAQSNIGYKIIASSYESWDGTIFGLFNDTISYPFTLIIGYLFFLKENLIKFWLKILFAICIFQAKSLIASLFFVYIIIDQLKFKYRKIVLPLFLSIVIISASSILKQIDFFSIYNMFLDQRLGIILWMLPELIFNSSIDQLLFGVGIGQPLEAFIFNMENIPGLFLYDSMGINGLNDVYYIAIFSYYGLIGLLIVIIFFYYIYKLWGVTKFSRYAILFVLISLSINQTTQLSFFSLLFYSHIDLLNSNQ